MFMFIHGTGGIHTRHTFSQWLPSGAPSPLHHLAHLRIRNRVPQLRCVRRGSHDEITQDSCCSQRVERGGARAATAQVRLGL